MEEESGLWLFTKKSNKILCPELHKGYNRYDKLSFNEEEIEVSFPCFCGTPWIGLMTPFSQSAWSLPYQFCFAKQSQSWSNSVGQFHRLTWESPGKQDRWDSSGWKMMGLILGQLGRELHKIFQAPGTLPLLTPPRAFHTHQFTGLTLKLSPEFERLGWGWEYGYIFPIVSYNPPSQPDFFRPSGVVW